MDNTVQNSNKYIHVYNMYISYKSKTHINIIPMAIEIPKLSFWAKGLGWWSMEKTCIGIVASE